VDTSLLFLEEGDFMASLDFTGFNGNNYSLNFIEQYMEGYNHYIIVVDESSSSNTYRYILFNSGIVSFKINFYTFDFYSTGGEKINVVEFNNGYFYRTLECDKYTLNGSSWSVVYSSKDFLQYSDQLVTKSFSIESPITEEPVPIVGFYSLRPIVEEIDKQDNIVESTFFEMFDILPALMVVLVSFIGIRKGISWLFSLLRRS